MNSPLTFEQLPQAISDLQKAVTEIKNLLLQKETTPQPEPEKLLTVQEAAKFLSLSVATIYGMISKGELPVIKKSKRCYFSNVELLQFMKAGRQKSQSEIERGTDLYISSRTKGGNAK